jgi:hypothetical protein
MKYTVNLPSGPIQLDSHESIQTAFRSGWVRSSNVLHPDDASGVLTVKEYLVRSGDEALLTESQASRETPSKTPDASTTSQPRTKGKLLFAAIALIVGLGLALFWLYQNDNKVAVAQSALSKRIQRESNGLVQLVSFEKTNGIEGDFMGTHFYKIEYVATIVPVEDCMWYLGGDSWNGSFEAVPGQRIDTPQFVSKLPAKKGQETRVSGYINLVKTDNGWRQAAQ